ncbi:hypothetical protein EDF36_2518 [Rathayibacter sp. PhB152]|uniref:HAAS signaling domain-containing protein n=1 Tax=unclassified Rathayibacter TaxID=2609250 RepID=UPI000F4CE498|nr:MULTISPECIES: hypothetical protein [unclassified Rathayibacter]ROQ59060.1 hypothetical protein EDF36_2518 [Rathayibacter sp. PhB152]TDX79009.1 hypothetical protein EDF35_2234 [Rathayibacter sp. PhB151]
MTASTSRVADRYLEELKVALADVRAELREEIYGGIAEELDGLDDDAARERISELGTPARIASAAGGSSSSSGLVFDRPWFAVASSLSYAFGWLLIPGAGWLIGIVALLLCSSWTLAEKKAAVIAPLVTAGVVGGGTGLFYWFTLTPSSTMTTWTVVVAATFVGGVVSLILGSRLCARYVRTRRAHEAMMQAR